VNAKNSKRKKGSLQYDELGEDSYFYLVKRLKISTWDRAPRQKNKIMSGKGTVLLDGAGGGTEELQSRRSWRSFPYLGLLDKLYPFECEKNWEDPGGKNSN